MEVNPRQRAEQAEFRAFVDQEILPVADLFDREEKIPSSLMEKLAHKKYFGPVIPEKYGGSGMDFVTYGLLHEEIGRCCSSTRSLLTVHDMVAQAILRWGSRRQKEYWMPRLASGEVRAAFALTEPNVGSDAKSIEMTATDTGAAYILNGKKRWITGGQTADLFLVIARSQEGPAAFLVERPNPGMRIEAISGMLGVRASMLAELHLENCRVSKDAIVGRAGFGFTHVVATALDHGRYSVAWGCVGIAQACLQACLRYTSRRKQFGVYLKEHQLIQRMITDMTTNLKAARLLCLQAGYLKEAGDPRSIMETSIAKYAASTMAFKAASDAVQIHGANGCSSDYSVQRYLRDAKIMEIIEGSAQMQQLMIAQYSYQHYQY
jgi:alkylation response protein AidB-like acyl-CoA dehydrogenase